MWSGAPWTRLRGWPLAGLLACAILVLGGAAVLIARSANGAAAPAAVPALRIPQSQLDAGGLTIVVPSTDEAAQASISQQQALAAGLRAVPGAVVVESALASVTDHFTTPETHVLAWVLPIDPAGRSSSATFGNSGRPFQ